MTRGSKTYSTSACDPPQQTPAKKQRSKKLNLGKRENGNHESDSRNSSSGNSNLPGIDPDLDFWLRRRRQIVARQQQHSGNFNDRVTGGFFAGSGQQDAVHSTDPRSIFE